VLARGLQVDLRIVPEESFGAALLYFTGSKAYNIELRRRAIGRGLKLNEYGLFKGEQRIAGATEESIYAALDLPWVPPEQREVAGTA
jgi:DNA polymerase (family 10)